MGAVPLTRRPLLLAPATQEGAEGRDSEAEGAGSGGRGGRGGRERVRG